MDGIRHYREMQALAGKLGYGFSRWELLVEALRHASYVNELGTAEMRDNERLEFLGDAVLSLSVSDILMERFGHASEGHLSKWRASVVNEKVLSDLARQLDLGSLILLGKGEELSAGREKPSILADAFEALLGAVYLDGGFEAAKQIVGRLLMPSMERLEEEGQVEDFKSLLQEFTQETLRTRPEYVMIEESGPPHDKTFRVALQIQQRTVAEGEGKSKKEAEQRAAKEAFCCLTKEEKDL